jgi:hypothetical protein
MTMSLRTYTQNLGGWLPLPPFFDDSTELPVTGLAHNAAAFEVEKEGQAGVLTKSTVSGDWLEGDNGSYQLRLTSLAGGLPGDGVANDTDTLGTHVLHSTINGKTVMVEYCVVAAGGGGGGPSAADIADAVLDEVVSGHVGAGSLGAVIAGVATKTDPLPSDPADASVVAGLIAGVDAKVDILDTNVDAINARLPSDPADHSLVIDATTAILSAVGTKASQTSVDDVATAVGGKASQASLDTAAGNLLRLLALSGDNVVIDSIVDPDTGTASIRQRGYNSSANADAAYASSPAGGTTGLVYTFTHAAVKADGALTKSKRTTS